MILQLEVKGVFATNSYFYINDETNHGFLIDPGAEAAKLLKIIKDKNLTIEKILLTHGHFDHIGAVTELQENLNVEVCMQKNGADYVKNPVWNLSQYFNSDIILNDVNFLNDYEEIKLTVNPNFYLKLIPVAGHTTDGAIYYNEHDKVAFVGDSIFRGSIGRTDFPGGNEETLLKSIKQKIFTLPEDTILLSGHSEPTTVGNEKYNSWFL